MSRRHTDRGTYWLGLILSGTLLGIVLAYAALIDAAG